MTCKHENTHPTASGARFYCTDCGEHVPAPTEDYYRLLQDGRRLQWRPVEGFKPKLHKTYIGAKLNPKSNIWVLSRVCWDDDQGFYTYVQEHGAEHEYRLHCPIDFIADDVLGVPHTGQGLPSVAA